MTRLLFIAERFPPDIGGLARSGARIAGRLVEAGAAEPGAAEGGVEVEVLTLTRTVPPGSVETVQHTTTSGGSIVVHRFGLFANLDLSLQHVVNLVEYLQRDSPFDAFWGHYLHPAGFLAVFLARMHGVVSTVSARGNDVDRMMFPPGDFSRLTWTLRNASLVTGVSRELVAKIRVLSESKANVRFLPNAVDATTFSPGDSSPSLRKELGIRPDETVLGFCGELRHKKGFPFLLKTLVEVQKTRPACLLVIGEVRAKATPHLQTFAAEHPEAAERILVTGRVDEVSRVAQLYRECDVVLLPSVWEGLPNALLEAMACERLVIASDAGGIKDVLKHRENGVQIDKSELHRLGEATLEVLDLDADVQSQMRASARRTALEKFAPAHELQALREIVAELVRLGETPSPPS